MSNIENDEQLLRRVHWAQVKPDGRLSSAAFKCSNPELSVDRAALLAAPLDAIKEPCLSG